MTVLATPTIVADLKYQIMPPMSSIDREQLKESLRRNGFYWEHAVVLDEDDCILDGFNRHEICQELGIDTPTRQKLGMSEEEKFEYIWSVNVPRRHLSPDEKRKLMQHRLLTAPTTSDRSIASDLGVDHKTVGKQRQELEASGEIPQTVRPHQRTDQERPAPREPVYRPDHLNSAVTRIIVNYPMPSEEERTRNGLPYAKEAVRMEWECELVMASTIPDSAISLEPFAAEAFERFKREVRARPFLTMRR